MHPAFTKTVESVILDLAWSVILGSCHSVIQSEHSLSTHPQVKESGDCILDPDTERFRHADGHWIQECGMSLHTTDRLHGRGLQIFGLSDSGLTMLPASAILRLCIVDSGLFTPLAALFSRGPQLWIVESWIHGKWEGALQRPSSGILETIMESGNVLQIWSQIALWNLGMLESAIHKPA